jgi:UMF1 family MFS transporter
MTFVFSVYLVSDGFGDTNFSSQAVATGTAVAGVLVALLAPALGQNSDRYGHTVRDLRFLTWGMAVLCALLFFVKAQPGYLMLGVVLYAVGFVINEIAGVNNNALLDQVANGQNVGRTSGFGMGMGYLGGIVSLLLLNYAFIDEKSWFHISHVDGMNIRVAMLGCTVWIILFTLPTFINLRDRKPVGPPPVNPYTARDPRWLWVVIGPTVFMYRELWRSIVNLWRSNRSIVGFLIASVLFRDALNAIFTVGGMVAAGTFGFSAGEVIMFGAAANVLAGVSTMAFGLLDDRVGPKKVILLCLVCLVIFASGVFAFHAHGAIVFWLAGLALCLFVGPAQAASRSYLARLVPEGRSGELFGLYATTGRAVSFVSTGAFAIFISIGRAVTHEANTQYWGILGIVVVLLAGLIAMIPVKEPNKIPAIV